MAGETAELMAEARRAVAALAKHGTVLAAHIIQHGLAVPLE